MTLSARLADCRNSDDVVRQPDSGFTLCEQPVTFKNNVIVLAGAMRNVRKS